MSALNTLVPLFTRETPLPDRSGKRGLAGKAGRAARARI